MHLMPQRRPWSALLTLLVALTPLASAEYMLTSSSLASCQANSSFGASLFDVTFTPSNNSLAFNIIGTSTISGKVTIDVSVIAYGLEVYSTTIRPCDSDLKGMCPMTSGPLTLESVLTLPANAIKQVPNIAYTVPDLDAKVKLTINSLDTNVPLACVQAELSNGKSVYVPAVCWVLAIIVGLGLIASAITSGMGNSVAATHVSANSVAMFGYFQSQAMLGMLAIPYPPIVSSWFQDFQWSMGIIRVGFLQNICTWYQRATGGTPTTILSSLHQSSVQVEKRSVESVHRLLKRSFDLVARAAIDGSTSTTSSTNLSPIVLRGIKRVGFRAKIETSNIFLTGYIFFLVFVMFVVIIVVLFKFACDLLVKCGRMKSDTFEELRHGFRTTLKGILFRVALIAFPQLVILCFWEMTQNNSGAEIALAIITIIAVLSLLVWASIKIIRMARNAQKLGLTPVKKLYADPKTFNKWGFLYVQYNGKKSYNFFTIALMYILIKCLFVAFGQGSGTVQAFAFVVIEIAMLVIVSMRTPYLDKKTDAWNIAILAVGVLNAILLIFFTGITKVPGIAIGVMGVLVFAINAIFALVLLILLLVASFSAILRKNPDRLYPVITDDRGSFIKSKTSVEELKALGTTARQDGANHSSRGSFNEKGLGYDRTSASPYTNEKQGLQSYAYNRADSHSPSPIRDGDEEIGYHSPNQRGDHNGVVHDWSKQGVGYS